MHPFRASVSPRLRVLWPGSRAAVPDTLIWATPPCVARRLAASPEERGTMAGGTYAGGGRGILDQSTPLMPLWWQCPHPAAICEQIAAGLPQLAAARASRGRGRGHWKGGGIARAMGAIPRA